MPGITGIITKRPSDEVAHQVEQMVDAMCHEKHYCRGVYSNKEMGIFLGWAGHAGTFPMSMPLRSADGNIIILFQGENYPTKDFSPADDEESYLVRLYRKLGPELFAKLNGWFCGVVVDVLNRSIVLFNDRYGMSRVYFHQGNDEFLFASEAKCILKVRADLRKIDPNSLAQLLRCNCVLENNSLFPNISVLPNASAWTFEGTTTPERRQYFHFAEWERLPSLAPTEFYERFSSTVSRVVASYAQSPHKVAMSLTAGLDTRLMMAALCGTPRALPCYTFGGTWGETFDISTARKVATVCKQRHDVIRINETFLRNFGSYAHRSVYISDGTHDAFGAHDVFFNEVAREMALIRLTGKFGSEVVRIRRLIPFDDLSQGLVQPEFRKIMDAVSPPYSVANQTNGLTRVVSQEIPWFEYGRVAVEQSQLVLRTPYMDNDLVNLMFQAPANARAEAQLQAQYVKEKSFALHCILTNLSRSGDHSRIVQQVLYLWFWSLFKAEYIYLFATPHWVTWIDRRLERLRPERLLSGRQKFEGYRIWLKSHFGDFVRDTLLSQTAGINDLFNKARVRQIVSRHLAGTHNYMNEINKLLTVELIHSSLLHS
jgi:asparagine synthase (glutamine-hydrolysing)